MVWRGVTSVCGSQVSVKRSAPVYGAPHLYGGNPHLYGGSHLHGGLASVQRAVVSVKEAHCIGVGRWHRALTRLPHPSRDVPSLLGSPHSLTPPPPPPITPQDNQELTDVERAIETVINQFHCYAVKGQKEYLTPNEMRELVVQKLPHLGKVGTQLGDGGGGDWGPHLLSSL